MCRCLHICGVYKHQSRTYSGFEEFTVKYEVTDRSVQPGSAPLRYFFWPVMMCEALSEKHRIPKPKSYVLWHCSLNLFSLCSLNHLCSHLPSSLLQVCRFLPVAHFGLASCLCLYLPLSSLLTSSFSPSPPSPSSTGVALLWISPPIGLGKWQLAEHFMNFFLAFYSVG